jgi:hypothetical protein
LRSQIETSPSSSPSLLSRVDMYFWTSRCSAGERWRLLLVGIGWGLLCD